MQTNEINALWYVASSVFSYVKIGEGIDAQEVFKNLPENTKAINIMELFKQIPVLGRIHEVKLAA